MAHHDADVPDERNILTFGKAFQNRDRFIGIKDSLGFCWLYDLHDNDAGIMKAQALGCVEEP